MKLSKLLAALALLIFATQAHAASLLPNGKQQFFAADGTLCVGCKVYFYIPSTTTPKDTWTDSGATILNTNPVVTDSYGSAIIYGIGTYREILKDANGNTLWDTITADQVSLSASWSGLSSGSPNVQTVTNANFSLVDGAQINFLAGLTNTGPTTLNVSGTGNISVVTDTSSGPQALGGGEITTGNIISVVYDATSGVFHIVTPTPIQSFNGAVYFNGTITPTVLAADQNDWTPTGGFAGANTVRVASTSAITITGLAGGASGRTVIFHNIGSYPITFASNSASSAAANRFLVGSPVVLSPNQDTTLQYDGLSTGWRQIATGVSISGASNNLKIVNDGTNPGTTLNVTASAITVEDSNGVSHRINNVAVNPVITASGVNGLDTGSLVAYTFYSVNVIYNPQTNVTAGLYSTSATCLGATLPAGYTMCAHVGWAKVDNSGTPAFYKIICYGKECNYATTAFPVAFNSTNAFWTTVQVRGASGAVIWAPPTASKISVLTTGTFASGGTFGVSPNNTANTNPRTLGDASCGGASGTPGVAFNPICTFIMQSDNIYVGATTSNASFQIVGWSDNAVN